MKRYLLFAVFAAATAMAQAQLEEDFTPNPTGWILSSGAGFSNINGNDVVITPGVGGNNPANIGTPVVNKTSNTGKVCFDIRAIDASGNSSTKPFPTTTYADILFVKSSVNSGFNIQRSNGNGACETVGFVATRAPGGTSSMPLIYQFKEVNMAKGNSWYRIVQIGRDGTRTIGYRDVYTHSNQ
jgi:hypothetical protein